MGLQGENNKEASLTLVKIAIRSFVEIRLACAASGLPLKVLLDVGHTAPERFNFFIQPGEPVGKNLVLVST